VSVEPGHDFAELVAIVLADFVEGGPVPSLVQVYTVWTGTLSMAATSCVVRISSLCLRASTCCRFASVIAADRPGRRSGRCSALCSANPSTVRDAAQDHGLWVELAVVRQLACLDEPVPRKREVVAGVQLGYEGVVNRLQRFARFAHYFLVRFFAAGFSSAWAFLPAELPELGLRIEVDRGLVRIIGRQDTGVGTDSRDERQSLLCEASRAQSNEDER
jgi:hypothetical protein